jgi:serine/threonine-protein phosphatase CPPED1
MTILTRKILYAITLILIMLWQSCTLNRHTEQPFFFIQMTDIQFGMHEDNLGFERETFLYEKAVAEVNRLNPDFVIITGDLVHDPDDENQIREFKRITKKINPGIPVYLIPGNHDIGQVPDDESMRRYHANYGNDRFTFDHKGTRFIGINSVLVKADISSQSMKQVKWLEQTLKGGNKAHQVIVFTHYPFFVTSFDEPENYSNLNPDHRTKYLTLFKENKVTAIFSGHLHNNTQAEYEGIQVVTTSAVGKPLGNAPSGFRIVRVYHNHVGHDYYSLDDVPDYVTFD